MTLFQSILSQYNLNAIQDKKNQLIEIIQEIVLSGLSRAGIFKDVAFYGGTALRIVHDLDRFSEDLDFSLKKSDKNFDLSKYYSILDKELRSFGLKLTIESKKKAFESGIITTYLKGNLKEHMQMGYPDLDTYVDPNELLKIKIEIDTNPPEFAQFCYRYKVSPLHYEMCLYDLPSLFASKIHAVLCRKWKNRVKGRDLYDYVFYIGKKIPINLKHLEARLAQSGFFLEGKKMTIEDVKTMLFDKFASIDYEQAKNDLAPLSVDPNKLYLWSDRFFSSITEDLAEEKEMVM